MMGPLDRLIVLLESIEQVFCSAAGNTQLEPSLQKAFKQFCQGVKQLRVAIESKIDKVSKLPPDQQAEYAQLKEVAMKLLKGESVIKQG